MRKLFLSILSIIIISSFCVATGFQNVNAANNEVSKPQSNVDSKTKQNIIKKNKKNLMLIKSTLIQLLLTQ